jgi:hypothetical protein
MDTDFAQSIADLLETETKGLLEQHCMQLAAISVAALCNTRESQEKREITKNSPYYSIAYHDVITAVKREIELREKCGEVKKAGRDLEVLLWGTGIRPGITMQTYQSMLARLRYVLDGQGAGGE